MAQTVKDYVLGENIDPVTGKSIARITTGTSGNPADLKTPIQAPSGSYQAPGFGSNLDESKEFYTPPSASAPKTATARPAPTEAGEGQDTANVLADRKAAGVTNSWKDFLRTAALGSSIASFMGPAKVAAGLATGQIDPNDNYGNFNTAKGWNEAYDAGLGEAKKAGIRDTLQATQYATNYAKGKITDAGDAPMDSSDPSSDDLVGDPSGYTNPDGATITRGNDAGAGSAGLSDADITGTSPQNNDIGATITRSGTGGGAGSSGGGGSTGRQGGANAGQGGRAGFESGGNITRDPAQEQQAPAQMPESMYAMPKSSMGAFQKPGQGLSSGGNVVNAAAAPAYEGGGSITQQAAGPKQNTPRPAGSPVPPAAGSDSPPIDFDAMTGGSFTMPTGMGDAPPAAPAGPPAAPGGDGAPAPADDGRFDPTASQVADDGVTDNQPIMADEGEFMLNRESASILGQDVLNALNDPTEAAAFREIFDEIANLGSGMGGGGQASMPDNTGAPVPPPQGPGRGTGGGASPTSGPPMPPGDAPASLAGQSMDGPPAMPPKKKPMPFAA